MKTTSEHSEGNATYIKKIINKLVAILNKIKPKLISEIAYVSIIIFINAICVINLNKISIQLYAVIILSLVFFLVINVITSNYKINLFHYIFHFHLEQL